MKTMMNNSAALLCALALLSGCAALGKYNPETQVSQTAYGDDTSSADTSCIAGIKWQDMFTDAALQGYINSALENNLDLKAAQEHIVQAETELLRAKLAYTPTLSLTPTIAADFKGAGLSTTAYSYKVNAAASWQLSPMRIANGVNIAKASAAQMEDYRQAVLSKLVAAVANNYYTLLMLDAQLLTSNEMLATWGKSLETVKAMKEAGMTDQVAVSQYEANYNKIQITVTNLEGQIRQAENSMCLLLAKECRHNLSRGALKDQSLPENIALGVPVRMLTLRPDVRAAQRDMELAFYATKGAILNFFPTLNITGEIGLVSPGTGAMSPIGALAEVGAGLVAPVFNAGVNNAALKKAESLQRESRLNFDKTLLNACKEVNDAYTDYCTKRSNDADYEAQVASLDRARKDTEYLMLNSFDKTYLDVLYANTTFFDAILSKIGNKAQEMQAVVNIYQALGGGTL